jgi:hypothetical protein
MDPVTLGLAGKTLAGVAGSQAGQTLGGAIGYGLSQLTPAAKAERAQLRKDTEALRQGKLGLSDAEKRSMLAGSMRGIQAQTAGAEAGLRRMAAAQGGFGRSGAQQSALLGLQGMKAEKAAGAMGELDRQSQNLATQRKADVLGRLAERRKELQQVFTGAGQAAAAVPQTALDVRAGVREGAKQETVPGAYDLLKLLLQQPNASTPATK